MLGSPEKEKGRDAYRLEKNILCCAHPEALRNVHIRGFALTRHPITQSQWNAIAEERDVINSDSTKWPEEASFARRVWEDYVQPGSLPASVEWWPCQRWIERLNHWVASEWQAWKKKWPELPQESIEFNLPNDDLWEVACRASSTTPFHYGDTLDLSWANYRRDDDSPRDRMVFSPYRPSPVGIYGLVNRWGFAEMHGNTGEWCRNKISWSSKSDDLIARMKIEDPTLHQTFYEPRLGVSFIDYLKNTSFHVCRGGHYLSFVNDNRSARRYFLPARQSRREYSGRGPSFRVCCPIQGWQ
jgi:formylglycine-generating enzyme required for sulfatase activity